MLFTKNLFFGAFNHKWPVDMYITCKYIACKSDDLKKGVFMCSCTTAEWNWLSHRWAHHIAITTYMITKWKRLLGWAALWLDFFIMLKHDFNEILFGTQTSDAFWKALSCMCTYICIICMRASYSWAVSITWTTTPQRN